MLENLGLILAAICILCGVFLIQDGVAGTTDANPFKLLGGAVILSIGLITASLVAKHKLEWSRTLKKYRQN